MARSHRWPDEGEIQFANVDLDVFSRPSLQPLADAFGKKVLQLYVGSHERVYRAHFELASSHRENADAIISGFVRLIERLPRVGRQAWTSAYRREFNIGIEGGIKPQFFELAISTRTLGLIHAVDARVVVTVYAANRSPAT